MDNIFLDDVYEHKYELPPIVAIDLRVQIFLILHKLAKYDSYNEPDDVLAYWSKIINNPLPWLPKRHPAGYRVCLLDDYKNDEGDYWRNGFYADYKKGRPPKSEGYNLAHAVITDYLSQDYCPIPVFKQETFEADDFAGCLFREKQGDERTLFLSTVDTDWLQLVDDNRDILWANCRHNAPRLRSEYEVHNYFASQGYSVFFPEEVIENKHQFGDKTDNYGPGTTKAIIDLRNPPVQPDPTEVRKFLAGTEANTCDEHIRRANIWLAKRGIGIL